MLKTAIVGFGNVGKYVYDAVKAAPDMELKCIIKRTDAGLPPELKNIWAAELKDARKYGDIDVAVLASPSRSCPDIAEALLDMGICTVDSYDMHAGIWDLKCRLDAAAKKSGKTAVIAAGWDPGSDSVIRALFEAMAPRGITYTNFGPGMSMGHSVAAKSVEGAEDALSVTIPLGTSLHRRMVYVQLKPGADIGAVTQAIKNDPYFSHDETHVIQTDDISEIMDVGHGVYLNRKGVAANSHNQLLEYSMKINGPAVTAQVLVNAARAAVKQPPGCYTLIELPIIDMLPGDREDLIKRLV